MANEEDAAPGLLPGGRGLERIFEHRGIEPRALIRHHAGPLLTLDVDRDAGLLPEVELVAVDHGVLERLLHAQRQLVLLALGRQPPLPQELDGPDDEGLDQRRIAGDLPGEVRAAEVRRRTFVDGQLGGNRGAPFLAHGSRLYEPILPRASLENTESWKPSRGGPHEE